MDKIIELKVDEKFRRFDVSARCMNFSFVNRYNIFFTICYYFFFSMCECCYNFSLFVIFRIDCKLFLSILVPLILLKRIFKLSLWYDSFFLLNIIPILWISQYFYKSLLNILSQNLCIKVSNKIH